MSFVTPTVNGAYAIRKLDCRNAVEFSDFLFRLRTQHWALSSSAFARRPEQIQRPDVAALLAGEASESRIGTFLLFRRCALIGSIRLDYTRDRQSVVFSNTEADPAIQRRGVLAMLLARPCLLEAMKLDVNSFQMTTWAFNRKAFPLYAKAGFRIIPQPGIKLISYFPLLFRELASAFSGSRKRFVDRHISQSIHGTLRKTELQEMVFSYAWKGGLRRDVCVEIPSDILRIETPNTTAIHH